MLEDYRKDLAEREKMGIPPKPLNRNQVKKIAGLIKNPPGGEDAFIKHLIEERVSPGVDPAAAEKAAILYEIAVKKIDSPLISPQRAVFLLGNMRGGYALDFLIELLKDENLGKEASEALGKTLLVYDRFEVIAELSKTFDTAMDVIKSWADAKWFQSLMEIPEEIHLTAFKVDGEINTDDFSPASEAWSRPDIPLHALSMFQSRIDSPLEVIDGLKKTGRPLAFVGDIVGTGSSRKSAGNSLIWHIGEDIPFVPNKRKGGFVIGGKIAPIFYNTMEDSGAFPVEADVKKIKNGDHIILKPFEGKILNAETMETVSEFEIKNKVLFDSYRAGGRIPLIIGKTLTDKAREFLKQGSADFFRNPEMPAKTDKGFTLAQKIIGKACGVEGVRPGEYCEPYTATVGSQDTTGPMTKDELMELSCMKFSAGLVMQSFCHTAAYPRLSDIEMHSSLAEFITERKGVALKAGDGIIHSWLNRMILPDTVGTGGDSHTRFPFGISFPAGSGLVAFAAAMGKMPLDVPESVLVTFKGQRKDHITVRDMVNAIPYFAIKKGLLTVEKEGKKNIFSGRILEIEGTKNLTVDEAYELTDASAERSAAASTIELSEESVAEFLESNICFLRELADSGYMDKDALIRRSREMEGWLETSELLKRDENADFKEKLEIDLDDINEPVLACPNDPDDVRLLSELSGTKIDEVFIGSCMTHIGHFRALAKIVEGEKSKSKLWVCPPTEMDRDFLRKEGIYSILGKAGARIEIPGCSLCMGNQARVDSGSVVFSTSTRNFPNRMGDNTKVFLGSAELGAVIAILGEIPSPEKYEEIMQKKIIPFKDSIYRFIRFDFEKNGVPH
ncbi:MAG: bifunctional aconitate hydratase 2/2-methylisocitrate dehydratase [Desulfobacteraceae bacterium]|nr:bifunctional aconitate hydratase 2/2-methylisocitrate dehydratase [Desulfobacteraceae bacterium]